MGLSTFTSCFFCRLSGWLAHFFHQNSKVFHPQQLSDWPQLSSRSWWPPRRWAKIDFWPLKCWRRWSKNGWLNGNGIQCWFNGDLVGFNGIEWDLMMIYLGKWWDWMGVHRIYDIPGKFGGDLMSRPKPGMMLRFLLGISSQRAPTFARWYTGWVPGIY